MENSDRLTLGRDAFRRRAWGEAHAALSACEREQPLERSDLELLATTAFLTGRVDESAAAWMRAHQAYLAEGNTERAVQCAFWYGFERYLFRDKAQASGWLARCQRLLDEGELDCVVRGYTLIPIAISTFEEGDVESSMPLFTEIGAFGERFGESTLTAISQLGLGHALIRTGDRDQGLRLLDEMMVAVTTGDVSPMLTGLCYCAVIEIYHELFDLHRAQEWTDALSRMYDAEPDLAAYHGDCRVHRAEIMQWHGAWPRAMGEVRLACERLTQPAAQWTAGPAFYLQGELYRLQGQFERAEESYRIASQYGRSPQPGLALLRLAQGRIDAAEGAIRREIEQPGHDGLRAKMLAAFVQIMLAIGDAGSARIGVDQLAEIAGRSQAPLLDALWRQATGAVHLVEGNPQSAAESLHRAAAGWRALQIPYESARARELIGRCCRECGDEDSAQLEFDSAIRTFRGLGAEPDLARVETLARKGPPRPFGGLTAREVEVLRLVAAGKTNRAIAAELFLSDKTVARHVSNIFAKLGVGTRSAATAYAFENQIV